ncbi:hypothetical protein PYW07_000265 [Mythimna separata]|uniref:Uncharacterized protein n=1 Tax=Mythimna separata TaxID=271217 RepID=A0AAD7Z3G9_MYTSE|nr:hypothetical protein PYW07_000265 [Mythimna separata]
MKNKELLLPEKALYDITLNEEELKKTVREEEELRRQEEVSRAAAAAKARRQEAEREERERRRQESELAAMRERHLRDRVAHISQTALGQKMLSNINEEFNFPLGTFLLDLGGVVVVIICNN